MKLELIRQDFITEVQTKVLRLDSKTSPILIMSIFSNWLKCYKKIILRLQVNRARFDLQIAYIWSALTSSMPRSRNERPPNSSNNSKLVIIARYLTFTSPNVGLRIGHGGIFHPPVAGHPLSSSVNTSMT